MPADSRWQLTCGRSRQDRRAAPDRPSGFSPCSTEDTIGSRDPDAIKAAAGRFDLLLSTVKVNLEWGAYLAALKPRGRLHLLGVLVEPVELPHIPMLFGQLSVSASPVGSPLTIRRMLDFAARHQVAPVTEHFPMEKVNDAMEHLRAVKARYRIVLDRG